MFLTFDLAKLRPVAHSAIVSLVAFFGQSAFAGNYAMTCNLKMPLSGGASYEYEIEAHFEYDLDRRKLIEVADPKISVFLFKGGAIEETYVRKQSLNVASSGDHFAVVDYTQAALSLNARLSFIDGPLAASAKVYHLYSEGERVATTAQEACAVTEY